MGQMLIELFVRFVLTLNEHHLSSWIYYERNAERQYPHEKSPHFVPLHHHYGIVYFYSALLGGKPL